MNSLQSAIDAAMKSQKQAQADEAEELGVSIEALESKQEENRKQHEYEEAINGRRRAVLASGILLARDDVERIAQSEFQKTRAILLVRARAQASDSRPMIVLCGGVGCGKTFAAAVAIASLGRGVAVTSNELGPRVTPYHSELIRGLEQLTLREPMIVLDDLGAEANKDDTRWAQGWASFCDHRQMHGRTIITSNLHAKELAERYDKRTIDRLNACAKVAELSGQSLRSGDGGLG